VIGVLALAIVTLSAFMLERGRAGLAITDLAVGTTPATLYQQPGSEGPLVVVAHGFAGSRQLMQAYSLTLAQSGYSVLAFDFEGHGRNPVPMSGNVDAIEGTTQRLVDETLRVLAAGRALPEVGPGVALLGHSMATDIIARAAISDGAVDAVVGISMFSQAVTAEQPAQLLVISGQWEGMLRAAALTMARLVDPAAVEGATVILIETYSYEREEGRLLTGLAEKLAPHVTLAPRPVDTIYDRIVELKQVDDFSKLLGTFLRKFKSGGYSLQDCETKSDRMKLGKRARAFLDVFAPVFEEYQKRLAGRIDFEDMILRAARYAETGRYVSPFRHILVDEFQDISQSRARLVKALKAQHPDVRVFAVGDDWQSIFRFAGSDIYLMRQFGREFGGSFDGEAGVHRTVDLGRTFRSVDQIAFAARTFVLRNPAQIDKKIVPAGTATEPAIKVFAVSKGEDQGKLNEVLAGLSADAALDAKPTTVLLLGRYRFNEPDIQGMRRRFPRLKINFKTIHASKGLEADHVVLLNADSGRMGFPSEIVDDPLLSLVSPEEEAFQNAEERRVMYVAMTRARHTLTILASNARPSSFVTELRTDPAYGISTASGAEPEAHVCGECGGRLLGVTGQDGRIWYRCEHVQYCGNLLPACPSCGTALPRHTDGTSEVRCECGASYPTCPDCGDGWLVERRGSFGKFLGCVRYPTCVGKAKAPTGSRYRHGSKR
jgi:DNA helicase-4